MVGWRDFCIKMNNEIKAELIAIELLENHNYEGTFRNSYFFVHLPGYGFGSEGEIDKELSELLLNSRMPGYYVMANNTTDTGGGYIRLEEGGEILTEVQLIQDGVLEVFQLNAPDFRELYNFLVAHFPLPANETKKILGEVVLNG